MRSDRAAAPSSQQGFVLVAVLWILLALSTLAAVFSIYVSASARALSLDDNALKAEALVSGSLELTAYQLSLADTKDRPASGSFTFRMDDADVSVIFTSEAARIDLNLASKELLAALFAGLGANKGAANEAADRIIGWRTRPTPNSTSDEASLYAAAGLNYGPRQSLFTHANELALVVGLPPALVERALPFVTVFSGSSDVDPDIAAPEVVAALQATGKDKPDDSFGQSTDGQSTDLSNNSPAASDNSAAGQNNAPTAKSPCYRVSATIRFNNGRRTTSEVVISLGDKVQPYHVLSWQDDVVQRDNMPRRRGA
jgi:general secretion pathway protein K